jgi:uncharacterized protein YndB with AHSA1/START domain
MTDRERQENTPDRIVVECDLEAPPEQVWRALTEPALLSRWLMPNDIRAEVGERFRFRPEPANGNGAVSQGAIDCEVLESEPRRLLRYSWRGPRDERDRHGRPLDSEVTFLLAETAGGGTRLRVIHSGFPPVLRIGLGRRANPVMAAANANRPPALRLAA